MLYTLQGREEPSAESTGFDLGIFSEMYRQERERQRTEAERSRLVFSARPNTVIHQFYDVEMMNGGGGGEDVVEVGGSGTGAEVGARGVGDEVEEL